tara:strand:- start:4325 stop:5971 length:1647 start_codon:yes stop_codon:yes gene_type:complete
MKKKYPLNIFFITGFILIILLSPINNKIDLTKDKRFTLNTITIEQIKLIQNEIHIDVFLSGRLPSSYRKIQTELKGIINSFQSIKNIFSVNFIDPFDEKTSLTETIDEMSKYGMNPLYVVQNSNRSYDQKVVFPWIIITYNKKSILVNLLDSNLGDTEEKKIINSIKNIEYKLTDAIKRLNNEKKDSVGYLTSHKTSEVLKITDWLNNIKRYYNLTLIDLKKSSNDYIYALKNLNELKLIIISNPREKFSQEEKFLIDQYQINGGNIIWLIDQVKIDLNKLDYNGLSLASINDLNLEDYFFKYGFRIKSELIKDIYCSSIVIADGDGNDTRYIPFPWVYYPISKPNNHIISTGIGSVWLRFASPIDTLENNAKKTYLLTSSNFSKYQSIPSMINLKFAVEPIITSEYTSPSKPIAILSEGIFNSVFNNRLLPIRGINLKNKGKSKMLLISEGQFGENQIERGSPIELGYDKWTNNFYSNKEFLMNSVHYLMGNSDHILLKSKKINLNVFDKVKIENYKINKPIMLITFPLIVLILIYYIIYNYRKKVI